MQDVAFVGSGLDLQEYPGVRLAHILPHGLDTVGRGEQFDELVNAGLRQSDRQLEGSSFRLGRLHQLVVARVVEVAGGILLGAVACRGRQQRRATSCEEQAF
jgi:hypothetical protein